MDTYSSDTLKFMLDSCDMEADLNKVGKTLNGHADTIHTLLCCVSMLACYRVVGSFIERLLVRRISKMARKLSSDKEA